jgi:hypothetical protein
MRSEEVSKHNLNKIRGLESQDRVDAALYHDFETEAAKKVCKHMPPRATRALLPHPLNPIITAHQGPAHHVAKQPPLHQSAHIKL